MQEDIGAEGGESRRRAVDVEREESQRKLLASRAWSWSQRVSTLWRLQRALKATDGAQRRKSPACARTSSGIRGPSPRQRDSDFDHSVMQPLQHLGAIRSRRKGATACASHSAPKGPAACPPRTPSAALTPIVLTVAAGRPPQPSAPLQCPANPARRPAKTHHSILTTTLPPCSPLCTLTPSSPSTTSVTSSTSPLTPAHTSVSPTWTFALPNAPCACETLVDRMISR